MSTIQEGFPKNTKIVNFISVLKNKAFIWAATDAIVTVMKYLPGLHKSTCHLSELQ